MKKRGFTLAEVLITLGIVGVVAALTAPALVTNSRNEANAAKLSVTMSNLENAFGNMIVSEGVDSLFQTQAFMLPGNRNNFAGRFGQYLNIAGFEEFNEKGHVTKYYGNTPPCGIDKDGIRDKTNDRSDFLWKSPSRFTKGNNHALELKNGAMVFVMINNNQNPTEETKTAIREGGGSLFNQAADIYIDVNGKSAPNTLGRDIFAFYLGDDGILYPCGGADVSVLDDTANRNPLKKDWNTANTTWNCQNGTIAGGGMGCTARVIAEGYKINY